MALKVALPKAIFPTIFSSPLIPTPKKKDYHYALIVCICFQLCPYIETIMLVYNNFFSLSPSEHLLRDVAHLSYTELKSATNQFNANNRVGRGGFGIVYQVLGVG